jgi:hypothetical protein
MDRFRKQGNYLTETWKHDYATETDPKEIKRVCYLKCTQECSDRYACLTCLDQCQNEHPLLQDVAIMKIEWKI